MARWIAPGVLMLVAITAVLQYRWIARVGRGERERLETGLRSSLDRFVQEFDGELARAFLAANSLRPGPEGPRMEEDAVRIAGWRAASPWRNMVRNFYSVYGGELYRFDADREAFQPVPWPTGMESVRDWFNEPRLGRPFAILNNGPVPFVGAQNRAGGTVVELDPQYIVREMLPSLTRQHFSADYAVQVVRHRNPAEVVFSSGPDLGPGKPDAEAGLLNIRPGQLGMGFGRGGRGPFGQRRMRPQERPFPDPPVPPVAPGGPGPAPFWDVRVRHTAGSLDAAASQMRRRDLAASALVLLLLTASIGALMITTRRAQRLASLQLEFVAGVSHELRTPLAVICSAADNLAGGVVMNEQHVRRYGALIRSEGRRLSEMIEQVLGYGAMQPEQIRSRFAPVDVATVIDRAVAAHSAQLAESGCHLEKEVAAGIPPVMADETSLVHCVGNLLANAIKYGEPGHEVRIAAGESGGFASIRVEDSGFGIDPDDMPHIFDAFYRGRRFSSSKIHGAGLGLSLVRRIMDAHGGTIHAVSTPGKGSCFTLRLRAKS